MSFLFVCDSLGIRLSKSLRDMFSSSWNHALSYLGRLREKRRLQSRTGWVRIHEKIKYETIRNYLEPRRNIHYRNYIQLNRWWWNES